ncbi:MAG: hypothetical protein ACM3U0_00655 [archaeon]
MKYSKKHVFSVLVFSVFLLVSFQGCSKKDSNPAAPEEKTNPYFTGTATLTLNGSGYSNKVLSSNTSTAGYSDEYKGTVVVAYVSAASDSATAMIVFPGKATGNFSWKGIVTEENVARWDGVSLTYGVEKIYVPVSGETKITSYGNVGQNIEGTFSGKMKEMTSGNEVSVSGSFKSKRVE